MRVCRSALPAHDVNEACTDGLCTPAPPPVAAGEHLGRCCPLNADSAGCQPHALHIHTQHCDQSACSTLSGLDTGTAAACATHLGRPGLVSRLPLALVQLQAAVQVAVAHLVILQHQQQLRLRLPGLVLLHRSRQHPPTHTEADSTHTDTCALSDIIFREELQQPLLRYACVECLPAMYTIATC